MNFSQSQQILEKIESSENILLNLHHNPDADSVGSATAFAYLLKQKNKNFKIITSSKPSANLEFLFKGLEYEVIDFNNFDFSAFELLIANDSSSWSRVTGIRGAQKLEIFTINVDHHKTNQEFADINLIVPDASANSLIIYKLFKDWSVEITSKIARSLLAGIYGDTGALRFPEAGLETYEAALQLMKLTDKQQLIFNLYQSFDYSHVQVWKEIIHNLEVDQDHKFVFSFIEKSIMESNGNPINAKTEIADFVFQNISDTKFGIVGAESDGYVSVSFRAREDVDVSVLASKLGGGGHRWAAAARVWEGDFKSSLEKVLQEAREFSKTND